MYWLIGAAVVVAGGVAIRWVRLFVVEEGFVGLLYRNGRLVEQLAAGLHWRFGWQLRVVACDTRLCDVEVPGQDVLTSDNLTVKMSLQVQQRVVDAAKAVRETSWWENHVYRQLQLALREAVAKRTFDELMADRASIGAELTTAAAPLAAEVGVEVPRVAVRDVMLAGELRRAFAEAVRLREEGKAALEKARSEAAALRCLANAARLMKDNPELMSMRTLQSIEAVGTTPGNTLVLGTPWGWPTLPGQTAGPSSRPAPTTPVDEPT